MKIIESYPYDFQKFMFTVVNKLWIIAGLIPIKRLQYSVQPCILKILLFGRVF